MKDLSKDQNKLYKKGCLNCKNSKNNIKYFIINTKECIQELKQPKLIYDYNNFIIKMELLKMN